MCSLPSKVPRRLCTWSWQLQRDEARKKAIRVFRDPAKESPIVRLICWGTLIPILSASDCWIRHGCLVSTHKERYWQYWKRLTPRSTFFLTMITAASSISSMLTDMNWPSLQSRCMICDLGMFFIKYIEVKSKSPYPRTSSPCLRMAVQGRVTTLGSGSHPLQLTLRNTIFM